MRNITEGIILAAKKRSKLILNLRPNVAIVGDSMLKHINSTQLRRSTQLRSFNTQIKTFPGATVSDMEYYVKPILARTPDQLILHVGTNDVRQSTPQEITNAISMLGQQIKKELPTTNLAISEVITRNDDPSLNTKITELSTKLSQVCTNNKWNIITHRNISSEHLNPYGLHRSKQGTAKLAQNFTNYQTIKRASVQPIENVYCRQQHSCRATVQFSFTTLY